MTCRRDKAWRMLRKQILKPPAVCWLCNHAGADSIDHVIPISIAPELEHDRANLRPAHARPCPACGKRCNSDRGNRVAELYDCINLVLYNGTSTIVMSKGRGSRRFARLRKQILSHDDICWLCHHPGADSLDHVIPLSVDPSLAENPDNLRPAHYRPCPVCGKRCNFVRGNRWRMPQPKRKAAAPPRSRQW